MTLCGATPITAAASDQCGATNVMMFKVSFTVVAVQVRSKYTDRVLPPTCKENFQHVTLKAVLDMVNVCIPIPNAQVPLVGHFTSIALTLKLSHISVFSFNVSPELSFFRIHMAIGDSQASWHQHTAPIEADTVTTTPAKVVHDLI